MTKDNELKIRMEINLYERALAGDKFMSKEAMKHYLDNAGYYEELKRKHQ